METREEDFVEHILIASTHNYILFFTEKGRCHWLKVYDIPEASRAAKGKAIINLIQIDSGDKITAFVPVDQFDDQRNILMSTKLGLVKKTVLSAYGNPRSAGIIAINLEEGDRLIEARLTDGQSEVILATQQGMAIRFPESKVRPMGRTTTGVKGISLEKDDEVVGMVIVRKGVSVLAICANGYGKRTAVDEYRQTNRGGKGIINIKTTDRNGDVVAIREVVETDDLIVATKGGIVIRMKAADINEIGRNTQGVRLIKLDAEDAVSDVTVLSKKAQEDENGAGNGENGENGAANGGSEGA
jgi:DNA gyrase subunit A